MNPSQQPKRKYTAEFKADVLRLVANGEPIMAVARKMGISDSLIHAWRKANDKAGPPVRGKENRSGSSTRSRQLTSAATPNRDGARDPKKSCGHFQPTNLTLTYQFIQAEEVNFPVRLLCKILNVSRSAYYMYRNGATFIPSDSKLAMTTAIDTIFWENSRRYGSRRVLEALKEQGVKAGRHRVRRLMQEQDWRAIQPRSFVPKTTDSKHGLTACPNRLIEFGKPTAPNQVWVGDITYLPLTDGHWAYLASWMDLFSRRIVGWQVDRHMKESLIVQAFDQALQQRQPKPGLIVHSDRGGQYFGHSFRERLAKWRCLQSMAEADNPYQNAHAESFWGRLKAELLEDGCFMSLEDARNELFIDL